MGRITLPAICLLVVLLLCFMSMLDGRKHKRNGSKNKLTSLAAAENKDKALEPTMKGGLKPVTSTNTNVGPAGSKVAAGKKKGKSKRKWRKRKKGKKTKTKRKGKVAKGKLSKDKQGTLPVGENKDKKTAKMDQPKKTNKRKKKGNKKGRKRKGKVSKKQENAGEKVIPGGKDKEEKGANQPLKKKKNGKGRKRKEKGTNKPKKKKNGKGRKRNGKGNKTQKNGEKKAIPVGTDKEVNETKNITGTQATAKKAAGLAQLRSKIRSKLKEKLKEGKLMEGKSKIEVKAALPTGKIDNPDSPLPSKETKKIELKTKGKLDLVVMRSKIKQALERKRLSPPNKDLGLPTNKTTDMAMESSATACKSQEGSSERQCVHFDHVSHLLVPISPFMSTSSKDLPECALDGDCAKAGSCSFIVHNNVTKSCLTGSMGFVAITENEKKYNPADPVEELVMQAFIKGMERCPKGPGKRYIYSLPNGKCYTVSIKEVDFLEGKKTCTREGGELVSVGMADQTFLTRWLMETKSLSNCKEFWTSAVKESGTGEYFWHSRGKPVNMTQTTFWAPTDKKHAHVVLSRAHKFQWMDKAASHRACVLCEA